jgi:hypothetical protein
MLFVDTMKLQRPRAMNGVGARARVSEDDAKPRMPSGEQLHRRAHEARCNGELLGFELTIADPEEPHTEPLVLKHYFQRRPGIDMLSTTATRIHATTQSYRAEFEVRPG